MHMRFTNDSFKTQEEPSGRALIMRKSLNLFYYRTKHEFPILDGGVACGIGKVPPAFLSVARSHQHPCFQTCRSQPSPGYE
jgi:hypothetical protein